MRQIKNRLRQISAELNRAHDTYTNDIFGFLVKETKDKKRRGKRGQDNGRWKIEGDKDILVE